MPTRQTTVLIADDHTIVKEGLVSLLKAHDFDVVGAVGDGEALIESARRLRPDVIVTDLSMPELSGLDVLVLLKAERIEQGRRPDDAQRRQAGGGGDARRRLGFL